MQAKNMAAQLIDGRRIASDIKENLKREVSGLTARGINPCLAVIFDGTDSTARKYVALKKKACAEVGIDILIHGVQKTTTQSDLIKFSKKLNATPRVNGILIQYPLLGGLDKNIMSIIAPEKDVDGCSPHAFRKPLHSKLHFSPCSSLGVIEMLERYKIEVNGKYAVIVEGNKTGRNWVSSLSFLLLQQGATVITCSKDTPNLKKEYLKADILCVMVGKPKIITGDMIKKDAVVIDMGMNMTSSGKVVGDIDDTVRKKAAYVTPVPGGIGPMTIAMLMHNTVLAAKMQSKIL